MQKTNWKDIYRSSLKSVASWNELAHANGRDDLLISLESEVEKKYPLLIPQHFAKLMLTFDKSHPLLKQFLPVADELDLSGLYDPIGDKVHLKAPRLIHRYENRALFLPLSICPIHCRYCFRKNEINEQDSIFKSDFELTLNYLATHPEIEEIIFSGGDPLLLDDQVLANYLEAFAQIPHLKLIRFHSRVPVILPERLTDEFFALISRYEKRFLINLVIHTNHLSEWGMGQQSHLRQLPNLHYLSQSVLLREVNDNPQSLKGLFEFLYTQKIRPYYLHHPDLVKGAMHFHLPLSQGREIYLQLKRLSSSWILPHYVVELPQGMGKVLALSRETRENQNGYLNKDGVFCSFAE
jgi:lysine 2,3-aminomutase